MGPAVALPVLHELVGQLRHGALCVPGGDGALEGRAPASELLDVLAEREQMGCGPGDLREGGERGAAAVDVVAGGGDREGE